MADARKLVICNRNSITFLRNVNMYLHSLQLFPVCSHTFLSSATLTVKNAYMFFLHINTENWGKGESHSG